MDLKTYLNQMSLKMDAALDSYLKPTDVVPQILIDAMRYSVFAGGKRIRPILAIATGETVGGESEKIIPAAAAIELIHTYSLIHDDLPAMDDDDFRRGKPSNHKVFGEAIAIVAGDGLLTYAFELLGKNYNTGLGSPEIGMRVVFELAHAAGLFGMVGGQVADLQSENEILNKDNLYYIHTHKTGAMIKAAVRIGAIISQATEEQLNALTIYAEHLGLAFQIMDDLLDVVGDFKKLGKTVGKDKSQKKSTFVALYGSEKTRQMALETRDKAVSALNIFNGNAEFLKSIADFVVERDF